MAKRMKNKLPVNEITGILAGAVAAGLVKGLISKQFTQLPAIVKNALPIGLGVILVTQRNAMAKNAGIGMIVKEGYDIVKNLSGNMLGQAEEIGQTDDIFFETLNSPADQSILSLPADQSIMSGIDEMDSLEEDFLTGNGEDEIDF